MTDHIAADQSGVDEHIEIDLMNGDALYINCHRVTIQSPPIGAHILKTWKIDPKEFKAALPELFASTQPVEQKPAAYQRRLKNPDVSGAFPAWERCSKDEATEYFLKSPLHEYRVLYTHPSPAPAVAGEAWISVKDALPELTIDEPEMIENGVRLAAHKMSAKCLVVVNGHVTDSKLFLSADRPHSPIWTMLQSEKVTHWMYVPAVPSKGEE